jgi:hypothetical protein
MEEAMPDSDAESPAQPMKEEKIIVSITIDEDENTVKEDKELLTASDDKSRFSNYYKSPYLARLARFDAELERTNSVPGFFMPQTQTWEDNTVMKAPADETWKKYESLVADISNPSFRATRGRIAPTPVTIKDTDDMGNANLVFGESKQPFRATKGKIAPTSVTVTAVHDENKTSNVSEPVIMDTTTKTTLSKPSMVNISNNEDSGPLDGQPLAQMANMSRQAKQQATLDLLTAHAQSIQEMVPNFANSEARTAQEDKDNEPCACSTHDDTQNNSSMANGDKINEPCGTNTQPLYSVIVPKDDSEDESSTTPVHEEGPLTKVEMERLQYEIDRYVPAEIPKSPEPTTERIALLRRALTKTQDDLLVAKYAGVEKKFMLQMQSEIKLRQAAIDFIDGKEKVEEFVKVQWSKDEVFHRRLLVSTILFTCVNFR